MRPNGGLVRSLREQKGWTQEGLADKALVDVQTLRRIERGERVRRQSLVNVAKALVLSIAQLEQPEAAPAPGTPSEVERLRAAVAADCGSANLLSGITLTRALPLRDYAVERSLALSPARPAERPRSLIWSSQDDGPGRWLVVGDVGSGKTTLLQTLARDVASDDASALCPVIVRLGELAQEPFSPDRPESLLASKGPDKALLAELAARGELLLLLDGLDEVLPVRREQVRTLLRVAAATWPCPIVVTSRPQGLRYPAGFELASLNPLDDAQVAEFLRRWRATGSSALPDSLLDAADARRNPLLLTFMALLAEHRPRSAEAGPGSPPRTRHELYSQVLDLLLEGLHRTEAAPRMTDLVAAGEALELIAHAFTAEGLAGEPLPELARRLRDDPALWTRLERVARWSAGPEEFLAELADRTGILGQPDGRGTPWRFWHRSLQELLTARRLARQVREPGGDAGLLDRACALRRGGERSQWTEPFTLLCGELARPDELLLALAYADPELAVRGVECARGADAATLRALVDAARPLDDERPRARTFVEGMRNWWSVVGDSARVGLVKVVEYRVGAWIGDDDAARTLLGELTAALGRSRVDALEVGAALDALARQLPCFRGPLRGAIYLQAARLLGREQARELALELWDAALARGTEVLEDLFFLDELLRRLHGDEARDAADVLYDRLPAPPRDLIDWRPIPAGDFVMGGRPEEQGFPWEQPRRRVSFTRPWEAAATQVTNAQYATFDRTHRAPAGADVATWSAQPAIDVSWYGAVAFCRWLSRAPGAGQVRLPTEAEWEYMARAGSTTAYWSGDTVQDLDRVAWYRENSDGRARPVGQKPANPWGLHDVHGNAWEWVQDWYGPYQEGEVVDPVGPAYGLCRVLRGGCFAWDAKWQRSAHRSWLPPEALSDDVGFRVVRSR